MLGSCARTFAGSDLLTVAPALFVALPMQRQQVLSLSITTSFWEPWLRMPNSVTGAPSSIWSSIACHNRRTVCSN